jgi:hypothetical protein
MVARRRQDAPTEHGRGPVLWSPHTTCGQQAACQKGNTKGSSLKWTYKPTNHTARTSINCVPWPSGNFGTTQCRGAITTRPVAFGRD